MTPAGRAASGPPHRAGAALPYIGDQPHCRVRQWLTRLAETAATVLVATHSAALLDSTSELINRVLILRDAEGTHLRRMTGALGAELAAVSGYLGLSKGELLLMT